MRAKKRIMRAKKTDHAHKKTDHARFTSSSYFHLALFLETNLFVGQFWSILNSPPNETPPKNNRWRWITFLEERNAKFSTKLGILQIPIERFKKSSMKTKVINDVGPDLRPILHTSNSKVEVEVLPTRHSNSYSKHISIFRCLCMCRGSFSFLLELLHYLEIRVAVQRSSIPILGSRKRRKRAKRSINDDRDAVNVSISGKRWTVHGIQETRTA